MRRNKRAERTAWRKWLNDYGAERFYDAFMGNAQDAESTCAKCGEPIYLDIREGGGIPDWRTLSGDYGCEKTPGHNGDHQPRKGKF